MHIINPKKGLKEQFQLNYIVWWIWKYAAWTNIHTEPNLICSIESNSVHYIICVRMSVKYCKTEITVRRVHPVEFNCNVYPYTVYAVMDLWANAKNFTTWTSNISKFLVHVCYISYPILIYIQSFVIIDLSIYKYNGDSFERPSSVQLALMVALIARKRLYVRGVQR